MIRKGSRVLFVLSDESEVEPTQSDAMLHDPSGREWPARSVLVGPLTKGDVSADPPRVAVEYLGRDHKIHEGCCSVETLPRPLSDWDRLGEVEQIYYYRHGTKARGMYRHDFNKKSLPSLVKGKGRVTLYRRGRWYRLELPRGGIADSRGFVWP